MQLTAEELLAIRTIVDELLLDLGRYEPLELLQREGRLMYGDYEAWRGGEVKSLDELLMGDIRGIKKLLEAAADYAKSLGLKRESIDYPGWGAQSNQQLQAHSDTMLDQSIKTIWQPSTERPQLDMFMDSPATSLSNGLRDALANRNPVSAQKLLEQLYDVDAGYAELGMFEQLVHAQAQVGKPIEDIHAELKWMQEEVSPAAHDILKQRARDFLTPLWQRLSTVLEGRAFDATEADLHLSYTAMQCQFWQIARSAIEAEPDWPKQAVLLIRRMKTCSKLHDEPASHLSCFMLCWQFPESLADVFNDYSDSLLKSEWNRFQALDTSLQIDQFPAWLLIRYPALAKSVSEKAEAIAPNRYNSYRLVHQLQTTRGTELDAAQLKTRQLLQQENAELFQYYMATQK